MATVPACVKPPAATTSPPGSTAISKMLLSNPSPSAKNVVLAIRLARHTAQGWDNAALPDDVRDIARLLNLSDVATAQVLRDLDS